MNEKDEIVPRDKANAILDFWRKSKKMVDYNEKEKAESNLQVGKINKSLKGNEKLVGTTDESKRKELKRKTEHFSRDDQLNKKIKLKTETTAIDAADTKSSQISLKSGGNKKIYELFEHNKKITSKNETETISTEDKLKIKIRTFHTKISQSVNNTSTDVLEVLLKDGTRRKFSDVFKDKQKSGNSSATNPNLSSAASGTQQKQRLPKGVTKRQLRDIEDKTEETLTKPESETPSNTVLDTPDPVQWKEIKNQDMILDYGIIFTKPIADDIYQQLEKDTEYYTGDLEKVRVYGKWHKIPRKQVAYGDAGLSYRFSGNCLPARPWTALLSNVRNTIEKLTGFSFNFVLINRYKDGYDTIGEHRDDEKDLLPNHPIASLSLGQQRDFVFRHSSARNKATSGQQHPPTVTLALEHGSLLMMKPPTNTHWYHSLPVRKNAINPRLNLTFRRMIMKK